MSFRGGEFSTGTTGNFQPELTKCSPKPVEGVGVEVCKIAHEEQSKVNEPGNRSPLNRVCAKEKGPRSGHAALRRTTEVVFSLTDTI